MAAARSDDEDGITSINITPLVDVFLVLLILIMISSSLPDHRNQRRGGHPPPYLVPHRLPDVNPSGFRPAGSPPPRPAGPASGNNTTNPRHSGIR